MTDLKQHRISEITNKLNIASFRPLDIMITGVTGAGKSSTLNSIFKSLVAKVGTGVDPETMEVKNYQLNNGMRLWDTPGLGDGVESDKVHSKKLIDLLYKTYIIDEKTYGFIDNVLVIIEGANRDMGTTYKLINEIIIPNFQSDRVIIAVNQADVAMKGRHWNMKENEPDPILYEYLEEQSDSIVKRVKEATGMAIKKPVYYSAEKNFNVVKLYDMLVDSIPKERRKLKLS